MKKILAVFDGYKISKSTMEYAIQLTQPPMPTWQVFFWMSLFTAVTAFIKQLPHMEIIKLYYSAQ